MNGGKYSFCISKQTVISIKIIFITVFSESKNIIRITNFMTNVKIAVDTLKSNYSDLEALHIL